MELSRRDALVALAGGVAVGGAVLGSDPNAAGTPDHESRDEALADATPSDSAPPTVRTTLVAAAEVLYPSGVDGVETFVETYVAGRYERDESGGADYAAGVETAVADLDATARDWHGASFAALDAEGRDRLLRDLGVDAADPDPDGTISERVRRFVVDDLLYALYTSPTGGRLVGIENPIGHPGGTESYQRATMDDR
jgi:hypothetical protein